MLRRIWPLVLAMVSVGCTPPQGVIDRGAYLVDTRQPATSAYPRIKMLVVHYTADDFRGSLRTLTGHNVSAHYLIPAKPPRKQDKPIIWQLVPENALAWHAGASYWRGATRINDTSIGIELENPGYSSTVTGKTFAPFKPQQIAVLIPLMKDIIARYQIPPQNVVAHADIAPQRKEDPGPLFPWHQLAEQGIGAWPDPQRVDVYRGGRAALQPVDPQLLLDTLERYGYPVTSEMSQAQKIRVISAFQMHFRPSHYSGVADAETLAIAQALLEKYGQD